jgi:hypothetical protein
MDNNSQSQGGCVVRAGGIANYQNDILILMMLMLSMQMQQQMQHLPMHQQMFQQQMQMQLKVTDKRAETS